jgi:hypothetical protein
MHYVVVYLDIAIISDRMSLLYLLFSPLPFRNGRRNFFEAGLQLFFVCREMTESLQEWNLAQQLGAFSQRSMMWPRTLCCRTANTKFKGMCDLRNN